MRILITFLAVFSAVGHSEETPLRTSNDVVYASYGERELLLDWYRPDDGEMYPGIVIVHGGGWTGGTRRGFRTTAEDLASSGYVVVNIEYRLAGEAKFPAAVLDVKAAVRWMRANATVLGLNPGKIGAVGGSAGGHLAALVAATAGDAAFPVEVHPGQSDALQAAVIMGAGVDQVARVKESKTGSIKSCVIFFGGEYDEVPDVYENGSPITHLSATTPPILMLDGEFDRPGERYVDYRKKLDSFSVTNEFVMVPGAKHGEWGKDAFRPAFVAAMLDFLNAQLK
ncbi:MAG: alpha/beta hydrolase [Verrucomicrobiales bacterium]|nr:alpha/beta hydrolase [Verrucomicrobiales bacterium]